MKNGNKHQNYEILNLIGYGLAKFDLNLAKQFGFRNKTEFYNYFVENGIAETSGVVKNRQDLFDPFFENTRKGWWQKGDAYIHRKNLIDSLFGTLDVVSFANIIKLSLKDKYAFKDLVVEQISPVTISRYKQLYMTGMEAESFFACNYQLIENFNEGILEDARMLGDGYDFQIEVKGQYFLAEIKGVRTNYGGIRLTEKEYKTAYEYKKDYALVVVSNLIQIPKLNLFLDPLACFDFNKKSTTAKQIAYQLGAKAW